MVDDNSGTQASRPAARLLSLGAMAAGAGLVIGAATAGFFWLITQMIDAIWIDLPDALDITSRWYALVVCSIGGLLIGLGQKYLGNHPALLDELMSKEEGTGGFDARILPQALYMLLVSLAFGGAVGPELSLVFVTGTVGLAMVARLRNAEMVAAARDVSIAAVFGAMFASPLGGTAVAVEDQNADRIPKGERVALATIAALLALLSFNWVSTPGLAVVAEWPSYESPRNGTDALWAVPLGIIGLALGLANAWLHERIERIWKATRARVLPAVIGGVALGLLGTWTSLLLFSGQDGIDTIVSTLPTRSSGELAALALGKLVIVAVLLGLGWKGGHFYPMLFAATALGLALSMAIDPLEPLVAVAAVCAGVLVAILRRVVAAALLVLLVVPASMLGIAAVAAVFAFLVVRRLPSKDDGAQSVAPEPVKS
jgi:H+/Cl- antiporter ClcA